MAMVAEFGQILKETFAQDNEEQKFQEYLEKVDAVVKLKESINNSTENVSSMGTCETKACACL